MGKYVIGVDFGTLSGRAVLADVSDGRIVASAVHEYPHGVMETSLPDGTPLPKNWALQYPLDYLEVLDHTLPEIMRLSGVAKEDVVAIGTDFTSATSLPVDAQGVPLCLKEEYRSHPHAYVKLWKHHAAQNEADRMTEVARERDEDWLASYGGKVSCEWSLPKLWQVLREAPEIYEAMHAWVEAGDWLVWQLCGNYVQNINMVGFKSFYRKGVGYPSEGYFAALDERLCHVIKEKCEAPILPIGSKAGGLTQEMADRFGLMPGIAVSTSMVDAHVCILGCGITRPGQMLGIIGTSGCYLMVGEGKKEVPGICGVVEDGYLPGYYGYETGQNCVGDLFGWMADSFVPPAYHKAAEQKGMSIHQYLTNLAMQLAPGESGLLALDWWNGNRSILVDSNLSGMLLGMTLQTKPEEIYRSLIESTAFGTRIIVENFRNHGVAVDSFYATGGISRKNSLVMQIYADVLNLPVQVIESEQAGALGSAIMGAAAAGVYPSLKETISAMASGCEKTYWPDPENHKVYNQLYSEYCILHDTFGRGANDVMKRLKEIWVNAR